MEEIVPEKSMALRPCTQEEEKEDELDLANGSFGSSMGRLKFGSAQVQVGSCSG